MRSLHVAALPYPAPRGTQAALDGMLRALNEARVRRSCCATRSMRHLQQCFLMQCIGCEACAHPKPCTQVLRFPSWCSMPRSCCSCGKLSWSTHRSLWCTHHVEAALCCLDAALARAVIASSLKTELPRISLHSSAGPWPRWERGLDGFLCRRFPGSLAVSPLLAELLSAESSITVRALSLPSGACLPRARKTSDAVRAARLGSLKRRRCCSTPGTSTPAGESKVCSPRCNVSARLGQNGAGSWPVRAPKSRFRAKARCLRS